MNRRHLPLVFPLLVLVSCADSGDGFDSGPFGSGDSAGTETDAGQDEDEDSGGSGTDDTDDGGEPKFDTASDPDIPGGMGCGGGHGDVEFSYIWVANSSQNTISKIDTRTLVEHGRYYTRPDKWGNPSRTSVNLNGDVAVANRSGGLTKVFADVDDCVDSNGQPGIQTSSGANDVLDWQVEECHAWHTPMAYASQRPVAWTPGTLNEQACRYEDMKVWTAGTSDNSVNIDVLLVNGDGGDVEEKITVQGMASEGWGAPFGLYGAAVDGDGNLYASQLADDAKVIRVALEDMSYEIIDNPAPWHWYGMTVDSDGYLWLCSTTGPARFEYETQEWKTAEVGGGEGCMADAGSDGLLWMAKGLTGIQGVNRQTLQVEKECPDTNGAYGISVDFEGYVWAVPFGSDLNRVDPETCEYETYSGLSGAYTYSDMTGFALANAGRPVG